jgi:hypothetical protein
MEKGLDESVYGNKGDDSNGSVLQFMWDGSRGLRTD